MHEQLWMQGIRYRRDAGASQLPVGGPQWKPRVTASWVQPVVICPCCRTTGVAAAEDDDVYFCSECTDRSRERPGRDYDFAELGGEA